tara:strand:- start:1781 stop:2224 length:444 start_codon:yes stop_codon:yes gene_type:complete
MNDLRKFYHDCVNSRVGEYFFKFTPEELTGVIEQFTDIHLDATRNRKNCLHVFLDQVLYHVKVTVFLEEGAAEPSVDGKEEIKEVKEDQDLTPEVAEELIHPEEQLKWTGGFFKKKSKECEEECEDGCEDGCTDGDRTDNFDGHSNT